MTAPVVKWMFVQRPAGHSATRITGAGCTLLTVAPIQACPGYTGRQVRNRPRTDFDLVDPANTRLGHKQAHAV